MSILFLSPLSMVFWSAHLSIEEMRLPEVRVMHPIPFDRPLAIKANLHWVLL